MGYFEALEDGIPTTETKEGFKDYYPPCHICGAPVYSWKYTRDVKFTCPDCRREMISQIRTEKSLMSSGKKLNKLETAIKRVSKVTSIEPYANAIRVINKRLDKPGWFQSTEEIMVALELIRRGIRANHQVRIYEYTVDFILPDEKVVLEIDGPLYHGKERQDYQRIRDDAIIQKLGDGWQMIRISTENINLNVTRLLPGIRAVRHYRKRKAEKFTKVHGKSLASHS